MLFSHVFSYEDSSINRYTKKNNRLYMCHCTLVTANKEYYYYKYISLCQDNFSLLSLF